MRKTEKWIPQNLADMFLTSAEMHADKEALKYKIGHHYESLSYFELKDEALKLAKFLDNLGIKKGDRVIIFSENRPEWVITDLALILLGAVNVPLHSVLSSSQLADVIKEIKPKAFFFSDGEIASKLLDISETVSAIPHLVSYENLGENNLGRMLYFKKMIDDTEVNEAEIAKIVEGSLRIKPEDEVSVIYTSGTSGHLKGVRLSHCNFVSNVVEVLNNITAYPEDRFFSILPLSHVFERTGGYYVPIYCGSSIGYALDLNNISAEIKERKPTIVIAVPRLFEKIYEKINAKLAKSVITEIIFKFALKVRSQNRQKGLAAVCDRLVFSKVREEFGGEIRFFVSGGAALPTKIGKFFEKVGLIVLEGYGLTESSPVVAVNRLEAYKFGTVGRVMDNFELKFSPENEILIKGPCVMKGYLREEDNKEAFTKDGFFKTGDLGRMDDDFLVISGRKKDLIVLTTGKKIAPVPIEEALEMSPYIEQAMVFGEGRKHIGAIIVPNFEKLSGKFQGSKHRLIKKSEVIDFFAEEALEMTKNLSSNERIKKFVIVSEEFSIENEQLTPTLKLRRHTIHDYYRDKIEKIYS